MTRIGQNPMRWVKDVHHPERITSTTIVYILALDGYWQESLDVLKLCLQSMRRSTQLPFDLIVFDNGSCDEVRDYLIEQYQESQIQYLIFSKKTWGKLGRGISRECWIWRRASILCGQHTMIYESQIRYQIY
ncbi:MAG: hypothetical protein AB1345_11930 [Chloroflexota bacterium]